jgi:glycosyltransferase involved in cell wall biosynthesis
VKINFVITQDLESPSGLGRYWPISKELARLGHQVRIIALHPNYRELENRHFVRDEVEVIYVAPMHVSKRGSLKTYYPIRQLVGITALATLRLAQFSLDTKADILHIGKPHPMNTIAGLVTRFFRGPVLFLDMDDYEVSAGRFRTKSEKWIVSTFEKWAPKLVQSITTNTTFMIDKLDSWGVPIEKIFYLPNGVDLERFSGPRAEDIEDLRQEFGLAGKRVIAYIGSLSRPSHPLDLLLEAFTLTLRSRPDAMLLVVGGGEEYPAMLDRAQKLGIAQAVRFCGRVRPEAVPLHYALADVSVDPVQNDDAARSRSPLKLLESWAAGIPFVTADVADRRMVMGSPPAGLLAEPGEAASLSNCVLQVLENPELAENLRKLGAHRVKEYSWERLTRSLETRYVDVYKDSRA